MFALVIAMSSFALAGAITPGPVNVLAMRHGGVSRRGCALAYVMGASVSYAIVVWIMGQSGQWLLRDPAMAKGASWLCAAYLLWLAWRVASAPVADRSANASAANAEPVPQSLAHAFAQGAAIQSLNPKAWLVALSGVGLFVLPVAAADATGHRALAVFCAVSLLACLVGVGCWAVLGRALRQWLRTARRQRLFNALLAAVLVGSVVAMLA